MIAFSLSILVALTPLFTLAAAPMPAVPGIAPHIWEMDSYTLTDDPSVDVAASQRYNAQFLADGRATFHLDCNSGQADYTAAAGQIALTHLVTTDALCPPGSLFETLVTLLTGAENYRFDDTGNLILRGPEGALRLRPVLTGVTWQWHGIADNSGVTVVAVTAPERYTLEFLAAGEVALRADCNQARARSRLQGATLAIRVGGVTRMACLSGSLGNLYLTALDNVEHWYLINGVLTLSLPDGAGMLMFSPVVTTRAIPPGAE